MCETCRRRPARGGPPTHRGRVGRRRGSRHRRAGTPNRHAPARSSGWPSPTHTCAGAGPHGLAHAFGHRRARRGGAPGSRGLDARGTAHLHAMARVGPRLALLDAQQAITTREVTTMRLGPHEQPEALRSLRTLARPHRLRVTLDPRGGRSSPAGSARSGTTTVSSSRSTRIGLACSLSSGPSPASAGTSPGIRRCGRSSRPRRSSGWRASSGRGSGAGPIQEASRPPAYDDFPAPGSRSIGGLGSRYHLRDVVRSESVKTSLMPAAGRGRKLAATCPASVGSRSSTGW